MQRMQPLMLGLISAQEIRDTEETGTEFTPKFERPKADLLRPPWTEFREKNQEKIGQFDRESHFYIFEH